MFLPCHIFVWTILCGCLNVKELETDPISKVWVKTQSFFLMNQDFNNVSVTEDSQKNSSYYNI